MVHLLEQLLATQPTPEMRAYCTAKEGEAGFQRLASDHSSEHAEAYMTQIVICDFFTVNGRSITQLERYTRRPLDRETAGELRAAAEGGASAARLQVPSRQPPSPNPNHHQPKSQQLEHKPKPGQEQAQPCPGPGGLRRRGHGNLPALVALVQGHLLGSQPRRHQADGSLSGRLLVHAPG